MDYLLNIILYNLFRFEKKTQEFFNYPVFLLLRIKKVKEFYKKRGVSDPDNVIIKALDNPKIGISSMLSGAHYIILFFLLIFGVVNFASGYLRIEFNLTLIHFVILGIFSYGFSHWFSFRQDRYLKYFKEFEKLPRHKKKISAWMTFFIVFGIWSFCIGSFIFLNYRL